MKPLSNKKGSVLLEGILSLPIILLVFFASIEISLVSISKRITQWACYEATRSISIIGHSERQARRISGQILNLIPLSKQEPTIDIVIRELEATTHITQPIILLGKTYNLEETFTIHQ